MIGRPQPKDWQAHARAPFRTMSDRMAGTTTTRADRSPCRYARGWRSHLRSPCCRLPIDPVITFARRNGKHLPPATERGRRYPPTYSGAGGVEFPALARRMQTIDRLEPAWPMRLRARSRTICGRSSGVEVSPFIARPLCFSGDRDHQ
jgi:hypothetical protein